MGKRGPAPKPRKLKIVEGNPGRRDLPVEVETPEGAPSEPDWLELFPEPKPTAKRPEGSDELAFLVDDEAVTRIDAHLMWMRTVPMLEDAFLVRQSDFSTLVEFCVCWARLRQAERLHSYFRSKEAVLTATRYRRALKDLIIQLGLSPASRLRLAGTTSEEDDEGLATMLRILN